MSDLIDRQAAIDEIKALYEWHDTVTEDRTIDHLKRLPSVQPEQKKGKWIVHPEVKNVYGGTYIECPQCGEKYVVQHIEDEKYCRNCGAKMGAEK